jgi:hypothetical protein
MKKFLSKKNASVFCVALVFAVNMFAGNADRAGQAGASELLINPWARNSGEAGANSANVKGLEATFLNVAGIAFTRKTELIFSHTNWLSGTGINVNAFGFTQRVGETGALGFSVMSMNFGNIPITTVDQPEGNIGTFSPSFVNLGLSYAKGFSDNIYGGMTVRMISEAISDVSARGVALDAGIQYVTGPYDNLHFGIAMKNVGPRMRYSGDGLSFRTPLPANNPSNTKTFTVESRSANFELPSLLNIGVAYDMYFSKDSLTMKNHRVTLAVNFTSNSFSKDQFMFGLEYGFKSFLMVRGGYMFEQGITSTVDRTTVFTGPTAGITFEIPFNKSKSTFALDYSYRHTDPFSGVHSIGARINL